MAHDDQFTATGGEAVTGWWSKVMNGTDGRMREVVEFRPDGTYITGICMLAGQYGWCSGKAVPQIQGNYSVRGDTLALQNGLMLQESLDDFGRLDAPHVNLGKGRPEVYRWRLELRPDYPPTGRPPARALYLMDANNQSRHFNDMSYKPPGWQNR